jgi:pimeloyl-ACP methyl ester carboxylesterase
MYFWQVGRFFRDADVRKQYLPLLYEQFARTPSARRAFFGLNDDLRPALRAHKRRVAELRSFKPPVRVLFGDADPYLNAGVARDLARSFPNADLQLVAGARHFVQMDEPKRVAEGITSN